MFKHDSSKICFFYYYPNFPYPIKKEVNKLKQQIIDYNLRIGPKVSAP